MATGAPAWPRLHTAWQGWSQMRLMIPGKGMVFFKIWAAAAKSPWAHRGRQGPGVQVDRAGRGAGRGLFLDAPVFQLAELFLFSIRFFS